MSEERIVEEEIEDDAGEEVVADESEPWSKQPGEPEVWYQRFLLYKLQDPIRRSVLKAENSERERRGEVPRRALSRSWREYSKNFDWAGRAKAWDESVSTKIEADFEKTWADRIMKSRETLGRLSEMARVNIHDFIKLDEDGQVVGFNEDVLKERGYLVKKITTSRGKTTSLGIEMYDAQSALGTIGKHYGLFNERPEEKAESKAIVFPADVISPPFLSVYRDIKNRNHTEYVLYGGRGSTKSSFISLMMVYLLVNNPMVHGLATRQVANTLRDSVYSQLVWAISELGLTDQFKCNTSPLEITYKPTGQKIYFRGADDPGKIKSIRPPFGYIALLWFEEIDQFSGEESIRKIEQSVIRGGDLAWIFKSFNPPRTAANWANKYCKIPKKTQYQHKSDYRDVPIEWLGKNFIEEAEHLKAVNPKAYEHEYLGIPNGTGGLVFENVEIRKITDEEIKQFDRVHHGLDWGYYPDPAHYSRMHYDAARMVLYIFGEVRRHKTGNFELYNDLVKAGLKNSDLLIADSAEPKSIADFQEYGSSCRGAEKGPESVNYSMKWLQSLNKIVIDNERCPETAQEFLDYELEQDKEGNFISRYPDRNNHAIDSVRYAMNLEWRKRGK